MLDSSRPKKNPAMQTSDIRYVEKISIDEVT